MGPQNNRHLRFLVGFGVDALVHSVVSTIDSVADYAVVLVEDYAVDTVVDSAVDR